jgi:lysozyme
VKQGQVITMKQAEDILNKDLERFVDGVNELVKVEVNQHQFNALVSLSFNVGLGNLEKSTLLKLVNQKEFGRASLEFTKWNKAGGKVLAGLTRRRQAESKMFTTPVPVVKPKPKAVYHTVVKGENLTVIGMKFKQSLPTILKLNPSIKDPHTIKIGQRIRVK